MAVTGKNQGRRYIGALIQSDPDVPETMVWGGVGNTEIYAEDIEHNWNTASLLRVADSPRGQGHGTVGGLESGQITFKTEEYFLGANPLVGSETPHNDAVYDLFMADATGTTSITRTVADFGFNEVTIVIREENKDGGAGLESEYSRCRGTAKITYPLNDRVLWEVTALPVSCIKTDYTEAPPSLDYHDSEGNYELPIVNKGTTVTLDSDEAAATSFTGAFFSGEVDLGMGPEAVEASSASGGVHEINNARTGPATAKLIVEQSELSEFNPYTFENSGINFLISLVFAEAGTTRTKTHTFYGALVGVGKGFVNKRATWELDFNLVFPDTGTNNSGQVPGTIFSMVWDT
jgi:hypothetical protein